MVNNFIPENIEYLAALENSSKDEFGFKFDLKRGVVSQYVRKISIPKLETIQRICSHFEISIDDFVNRKLSELTKEKFMVNEPGPIYEKQAPSGFVLISEKHLKLLESTIEDKNKIIKTLETRLGEADKSETA